MQKILEDFIFDELDFNDNEVVTPLRVIKRNGAEELFNGSKIINAIKAANGAVSGEKITKEDLLKIYKYTLKKVIGNSYPGVEEIQNSIEEGLIHYGYSKTAKAFIIYREDRRKVRDSEYDLMKIYKKITFNKSSDDDSKRENANIDSDTAMGAMLKYGSEGSKYFVDKYILPKEMAKAHENGDIHIHDKDFYMLTETCCQINLRKLFKKGFSTGHGHITEPMSIGSYASLACIVLQANQNEMHGGQSIPDFDYAMEDGVNKSYKKILKEEIRNLLIYTLSNLDSDSKEGEEYDSILNNYIEKIISQVGIWSLSREDEIISQLSSAFMEILKKKELIDEGEITKKFKIIKKESKRKLTMEVYQAMQALVHNLNTMNSRAGAQVPFSSINYGTSTSEEGRLVVRELLKVTNNGIGIGETPIFPVQIFKVKEGINFNTNDKNFDLLTLAMKTSAKRLYPNFSFLDASFNKEYYKEGDPGKEVAYMGCRTRVMGNIFKEEEITYGRGNLSFTSINLPRLGLLCKGDIAIFFKLLDEKLNLVKDQLLHRFKIQSSKKKYNYPFLLGEGVWINSESIKADEEIYELLKHGTLSIGFIGLAECLVAITGYHHGERDESQKLGLKIISHMRRFTDDMSKKYNLNFSLIATPAEGLSGRFVKIDQNKFGMIKGITDREYYTNSFHIPVYCEISMIQKIKIEGQYHKLTNGGHISYVEVNGDIGKNINAFYKILKMMKEADIGYGSINHPVDYDPVCNYTGIIDDKCPRCNRHESLEEPFSRIRRITGYLVGSLDRFNDAKRSEVLDRVKHN